MGKCVGVRESEGECGGRCERVYGLSVGSMLGRGGR